VFAADPPLACPDCNDATPADPLETRPTLTADTTEARRLRFRRRTQWLRSRPKSARRAISAANAYVMTDIMTDVVQRGTAQRAKALGRTDIAGKTAPERPARRWFVGFNADLAAAAWSGSTRSVRSARPRKAGTPRCRCGSNFMQEALRDKPEHRLPEPPGIVRMWVSRSSGAPSSAGSGDAIFEAFLEQYTPRTGESLYGADVDAESVQRKRPTNPYSDGTADAATTIRVRNCCVSP